MGHRHQCSGPATGWFANSFRSEGIGQLALLVFLESFLACCQLLDLPIPILPDDTPWIRIATDNQGLLIRIAAELATTTAFAGAGLSPEYDVVHEIIEITRRLPTHPSNGNTSKATKTQSANGTN